MEPTRKISGKITRADFSSTTTLYRNLIIDSLITLITSKAHRWVALNSLYIVSSGIALSNIAKLHQTISQ